MQSAKYWHQTSAISTASDALQSTASHDQLNDALKPLEGFKLYHWDAVSHLIKRKKEKEPRACKNVNVALALVLLDWDYDYWRRQNKRTTFLTVCVLRSAFVPRNPTEWV